MLRRYTCVRQNDQSDCGAAALATIALHHRIPIGLETARDLAGTDRVGTNLLGLSQAAESIGFSARAVRGPYEALAEVPLPAVAHVENEEGLGHFVVLHRVRKRSVLVADPGRGLEKLSREEFSRQWTGYLLLLTPERTGGSFRPSDTSPGPWRRFLELLRPHRSVLLEAFVCAILLTLLGLSTSFFIRHLVDSVLVHNEWKLMNALAIGMLAVVVFRSLFGVLRQYFLMYVGRKVDLTLISGYVRHVLRLPLKFFDMRRVGEIISRVHDASRIRSAVSGATLSTVVDGTLVGITAVVMFLYDRPLAVTAFAFVPALVISVLAHHPGARKLSRETMEKAAVLQSHMVEDITGIETIKAFGLETARAEEGDARLVKVVQSAFSLQLLGLSMNSTATIVKGIAAIVILWYGGHRVLDGALSIGELMFFHSVLGCMLEPLERLSSVNLSIQEALVAIDRLYQVMDLELEHDGKKKKVPFEGLKDGIELENVNFKYGCRSNVLDDISLRIPAGATVAIVGESGSGKSTLLKLLMRFYEPTGGRITIDAVDARHYSLASLRDRIAVVSQEPFIFSGTVRENIALHRPGAPMDEVVTAARTAGLEDFVESLSDSYETVIGERGANLSGGQRQRLAIARALMQKPEILIFDEATSHLDTATERAIQTSLQSILREKTVVLVAHRLSTVRSADRIYVVDKGRIVEQGTHRQLVEAGGRYARLWRDQTGAEGAPSTGVRIATTQPSHEGDVDRGSGRNGRNHRPEKLELSGRLSHA